MTEPSRYRVVVCDLPDHESLVAEVYFGDTFIGLVSEEEEPGLQVFEFGGSGPPPAFKVPLSEFVDALAAASKRLLDLKRSDASRG